MNAFNLCPHDILASDCAPCLRTQLATLKAERDEMAITNKPLASGKVVACGDKRLTIEWTSLSGVRVGDSVDVVAALDKLVAAARRQGT